VAPMEEKRVRYERLVNLGVGTTEACQIASVDRRTGSRWRYGRTVINTAGTAHVYAPTAVRAPWTYSARLFVRDGTDRHG